MKNSILLFAFFSLMLFSCLGDETETEPVVEEEFGWVKNSRYLHDFQALRGVIELDNYLLTLHDFGYGIKVYNDLGNPEQLIFHNLIMPQASGRRHKHMDFSFPVSDKYLVTSFVEAPNSIFVYSLNKPFLFTTPISGLEIKGEDIDPNFREFRYLGTSRGDTFALNGNHILVCYAVNNDPRWHLRFALIEVELDTVTGFGVDTKLVSIKTIKAPQREDQTGNNLVSFIPVNDGFVGTTFFSLFKVDFEGNVKVFERENIDSDGFERYTESFLVKDHRSNVILCAEKSRLLKSYYSTDEGETWSLLSDFSSNIDFSSLDLLRFEEYNGALYGFYNSQIFQLSISPNQLTVNELDNIGLESHKITGISSYYQDSLVMVSTRSGAFYKPAEDFLKPKISDSMGLFSGGF
ncbi:hypothetical protein [Belliella pelovolcani]|uniref:hypothetical protein n=1 Tax=Belliella pelovolcani TaxID=529505 RepID=UPI00391CE0A4